MYVLGLPDYVTADVMCLLYVARPVKGSKNMCEITIISQVCEIYVQYVCMYVCMYFIEPIALLPSFLLLGRNESRLDRINSFRCQVGSLAPI